MPDCLMPLPECLERLKNIESDTKALRQAVLGNGASDRSIISRLARLEAESGSAWKFITILIAAAAILVAIFR